MLLMWYTRTREGEPRVSELRHAMAMGESWIDPGPPVKYVIIGMMLCGLAALYVLRRVDLGRDPLGDDADWSVP